MGIAVGMATSIPPHNFGEVIEGVKAYMKNPDIPYLRLFSIKEQEKKEIQEGLGIGAMDVVAVAGHDTQCALTVVPSLRALLF